MLQKSSIVNNTGELGGISPGPQPGGSGVQRFTSSVLL